MGNWSVGSSRDYRPRIYKSEKGLPKTKRCLKCGKRIARRSLCWSCYYEKRKGKANFVGR